ncbi:uncharacterized protein BBOV_IV003360 [Babesia bovis T2Bo]|uniref:NAD(+) kinase n=1 Tax=Babesia bovis TaxID=5865 RepID=A7AVV6_BABBO|nr:uncharacterized protein BBOV_IV003360 [Babesia bovis T2Bo]EDO05932.1 hypothetical protein BBOV_IV003360 [Babesia bovis T2Bo]|eukprot:XP_001609500.1 hypothetical protein [Babesia bovis T2Bo]
MKGLSRYLWLRIQATALRCCSDVQGLCALSRRSKRFNSTCRDVKVAPSELCDIFKNVDIHRIVILEKVTKYDLERRNGLSDSEIRDRFPLAYRTHQTHTKIMEAIVRQLKERYSLDTMVIKAQSHNLTLSDLEKSSFPPDLIISAGGDGTFLEAASMIPPTNPSNKRLFIVGINTDPERSVGALCLSYFKRGTNVFNRYGNSQSQQSNREREELPKQNMIRFSETGALVRKECTSDTIGEKEWADISSASFCGMHPTVTDQNEGHCTVLSRHTANIYNLTYDEYVGNLLERLIVKRDYEPISRQRIRIKMFKRDQSSPTGIEHNKGDAACIEEKLFCNRDSQFSCDELNHESCDVDSGILPYGAVNEVIIADENLERTFYGLVQVDSSHIMRVKSSGVLISTGTGSTAWAYNMCKMNMSNGVNLFKSLMSHPSFPKGAAKHIDVDMMKEAVESHNANLVFPPSENTLKCIIREAIYETSTVDESAYMGTQVKLLALSKNASMYIDGSKVLKLDYGDVVVLKTFDSDTIWSCV